MSDSDALTQRAASQVRYAAIALADVLDLVESDDENPHEQRSRLSDLLAAAYRPDLPELGELQSMLMDVADELANRTKTYHVTVSVGEDDVREYAVEADTEEMALNIATERVRDLVGGFVDGLVEGPDEAADEHLTIADLGPQATSIVRALHKRGVKP